MGVFKRSTWAKKVCWNSVKSDMVKINFIIKIQVLR
jgi:hypothetical protein